MNNKEGKSEGNKLRKKWLEERKRRLKRIIEIERKKI